MAPIKSAVLESWQAPQNGVTADAALRSMQSEIQRDLGLFARYKIDALALAAYLLQEFRALGIARFNDDRVQRLAAELANCCSYLWFKQHPGEGRSKLHRADFCDHRLLCINCSRRSSFVWLRRLWFAIKGVRKTHPGARCYSGVLTMPNTSDLRGGILLLRSSIVKLMNRARKNGTGPLRHVLGVVTCYEVTRGTDGKWHPHVHCLFVLAPGQRIDAAELRRDWSDLTGGRQIKLDAILKEEDLLEVFKYTLKTTKSGQDGLSLADRSLAYFLLLGTRLRECYGLLRGIPDDLDDTNDPGEDVSTWNDIFYRWAGSSFRRVSWLHQE